MAQSVINVRMDEDLKNKFSEFCTKTGLTMSTAISMFARVTVRNQELPFMVTTKKRRSFLKSNRTNDPFYSEENQQRLYDSAQEAKNGKVTYHDVKDLEKYL